MALRFGAFRPPRRSMGALGALLLLALLFLSLRSFSTARSLLRNTKIQKKNLWAGRNAFDSFEEYFEGKVEPTRSDYSWGLDNVLVLNSLKAVNDLLDRRAAIYSDRPSFAVVGDLMGLGRVRPLPFYFCPMSAMRVVC